MELDQFIKLLQHLAEKADEALAGAGESDAEWVLGAAQDILDSAESRLQAIDIEAREGERSV